MGKCCYICGVTGWEDLLATCMECNSAYIHQYCMKTIQFTMPDDWVCENCQKAPKQEKPSVLPSEEGSKQNETTSKQKRVIKYPMRSSISRPSPDLQSFKELFIPASNKSIKSRRASQGGDPCKYTLKAKEKARDQGLSAGKLTLDRHLLNHPASYTTWRGRFRISGFVASVCSCNNVLAYPPAKVSKKAYEFSKKMPSPLHFEAISRSTVWETLFNDGGPDKYDIGLYFFPNGDISEESYFRLISDIEKQEIVLKTCMSGAELLVFSSSCLDESSKHINKSYYMWGLFDPPVAASKKPDQNQLPAKTNTEPVDEQDVAKNEVPVPRDPLLTSPKTRNGGSQPASGVRVQPKLEKWDGFIMSSPPGFPALPLKPRVPPGFEEESRRVKFKTQEGIQKSKN